MMPQHTPSGWEKDCQQRTRGEYATRRGLIDKEYSWGNDLSIGHDYAHVGMSVARDREPWVDWQDIPLTAESLNEVYAGIQTAGAFLFITSSDFASLRDR